MPLYEYECDACGARFERIQKFSDPPVAECPTCGGSVRKLISSPAIQFKGSGWYITDYAKSSEKKATKEGASKDESASKSEKSTEAKSDASTKTSESSSKPAATPPASSKS